MKKQILLFLLALLPMVAWADESGTCGDNLTWTYVDLTKTLTISGTGTMQDYDSYAPWYNPYSSELQTVVIENGVTSIGDMAFAGCDALTSVTIPNSVTSIGEVAFADCPLLTSIAIPESVKSIGFYVLNGCSSLTSIIVAKGNCWYDSRGDCNAIIETSSNMLLAGCKNTVIPSSVTSIGNGAFSGCCFDTPVTIPENVTSIGQWAFNCCI